jgi:hypothetical protein
MADPRFTGWPTEGVSLVEAIGRIAGPDSLAECRAAQAATPIWAFDKYGRGSWTDNSGKRHSLWAKMDLHKRAIEVMRTNLVTVIDAWNAGEIRATGRRGVLTDTVEIHAPADLWVVAVVDWERSIIEDPDDGKIFDLRFHVGAPRPPMAPLRWLEGAVAEWKRVGNIPEKPTDFARLLLTQMIADHSRGKVKKVWALRTIVNNLREIL